MCEQKEDGVLKPVEEVAKAVEGAADDLEAQLDALVEELGLPTRREHRERRKPVG